MNCHYCDKHLDGVKEAHILASPFGTNTPAHACAHCYMVLMRKEAEAISHDAIAFYVKFNHAVFDAKGNCDDSAIIGYLNKVTAFLKSDLAKE